MADTKEEKLAKLKKLKDKDLEKIHEAEMDVRDTVEFELSELPGVGAVRQNRLEESGITTPLDLIIAGPVEIASVTGMEQDQTDELDKVAREFLQNKNIVKKCEGKPFDKA